MTKKLLQILLLEDNPGDARLFREYLHEDDLVQFELDHVERLKTGLEHLVREKPDAILLDLGLPDSQGLETFSRVYAQAPEVPIVVLTGLDDAGRAVEAVKAGAQDYLVKGDVSGGLLVRAIHYAIERKESEKALVNAAAEWRTTFDSVSDGVCLLDKTQKIQRANQAMSRMFGKNFDEMVGRHCCEVVHGAAEPVPGCPILRAQKSLQREKMEYQIGAGWFEVTVDPILDASGQYAGAAHIISDITMRKRAEEALRESEEKWHSLVSATPDFIALHDQEGRFQFLNHYAEGYTEKDVIGSSVYQYLLPEAVDKFRSNMEKALNTGTTQRFEHKAQGDRGATRTYEDHLVPIHGKNQEISIMAVSRDITERVQTEQAIHLMSDTQKQIAHLDNLMDIYRLVGEKIQELVGDIYVSISMLNEQNLAMNIVGLYGFGDLYEKLVRKFKVDPSRLEYALKDMTDDELRIFRSGKLEKIEGGLYTMLARKVPKSICDLAEKQLEITGIYAMGFTGQDVHYGGLTLLA
jgi:PAS domain S-box-containing protein